MNKLEKWLWGIENRMYSGVVMFNRDVRVLFGLYKKAVKELKQQTIDVKRAEAVIESYDNRVNALKLELSKSQDKIKELTDEKKEFSSGDSSDSENSEVETSA